MSRLLVDASRNAALDGAKRATLQRAIDAADATATRVANYPRALGPVSVAQFLLESNWGLSDAGGVFNYFGIKARGDEPFVARQTREVVNGKWLVTTANFRRFGSIEECFAAHADLICNRRSSGTGRLIYERAMMQPANPIAFAGALTGVYATDPEYGAKLIQIMIGRGLLQTFGFGDLAAQAALQATR